jgi:hypothetical protein
LSAGDQQGVGCEENSDQPGRAIQVSDDVRRKQDREHQIGENEDQVDRHERQERTVGEDLPVATLGPRFDRYDA